MSDVVSLVDSPCNPDSRVMRIAEALVTSGRAVTVVCKYIEGLPRRERINGVSYVRVPMRARLLRPRSGVFKFRAFESFVADEALSAKPAAIHANDLIALPAAVRIAGMTGAKVVYDVHDLYLHGPKRRSRLARWHGERTEQHNIRLADAVMTVSDGLADHLQRTYGITRPAVVMNAPAIRPPEAESDQRRALRDELNLRPEVPLAVYTGARHSSRGLENIVSALGRVTELHLALVGHKVRGLDDELRRIAERGGCLERLHILPPVPHDLVTAYISSADFAVISVSVSILNHRFAMPHKLFEAVFAGLPVAVSQHSAMDQFVAETGTGMAMDTDDVAAIAAALTSMTEQRAALRIDDTTVAGLKAAYGWPVQERKLLEVYDDLLSTPSFGRVA